MIPGSSLSETVRMSLRQQLDARMEGMRSTRLSFWAHWAQLAEVFLPRRYKWFVTPNQWNRGAQINQSIIDETGVIAARTMTSGMMSGLTSPTRPWFRLGLHSFETLPYGPVKSFLAECERRMQKVLQSSNFYQALGTLYHDNGVFGSAGMIVYEDPDQVIRCYNPCLGEFFFDVSSRLDVDTLYREYTLTVSQAVDQFGLANLSPAVQQGHKSGGANRQREVVICHAIEPNSQLWEDGFAQLGYAVPKKFKYREVYWEKGAEGNHVIQCAGYNDKPFVAARWDVVSNDPYGRSPGMDALPAVRQLQLEQRRKGEAIDKLVRPPMVADVSMKNDPASILPGGISYVANLGGAGFKPAFQVEPHIQEMMLDIKEVQARINSIFFVDLFMMISQLDTVRTATEIDARREEKLIQLGPVIERFENEVLDPIIQRVFNIMWRRGLFPAPPPELQAMGNLQIQYVSMLAQAQRAAQTAAIERVFQLAGNLAGVHPDILDVINWDGGFEDYADLLDAPTTLINEPKVIASIRQAKAQAAQQQQAMQTSMAAVQAAQGLSKTEVGGGQNALSMMLGNQGPQSVQ